MVKITCQHCAIHHMFWTEEIVAVAKAIHLRACQRAKLDPSVLTWDSLATQEQNCYLDYASAALDQLEAILPAREPPLFVGLDGLRPMGCDEAGE